MIARVILIAATLTSTCLIAAGAEPAGTADTSEKIEFSVKAVPGEVSHHRVVTKSVGSMKLFESLPAQRFAQTFEQDIVVRCLRVNPDGSAVCELTMPRVGMKMNFGGLAMEFYSDRPEGQTSKQPGMDIVGKLFMAFTKIKCQMLFSPTGEPLKVEGLSEGVSRVMDEIAGDLPIPGMKSFFDRFGEYMADDSMLENMRSAHRMIPNGATARIGDRWEREWEMEFPPFNTVMRGNGQYELVAVEEFRGRRCAKIRGKQSLTMRPGAKPAGGEATGFAGIMDRMKLSMDTSGGEMTAYWDFENGEMVDMRETQRMTIEISMEPGAEGAAEAAPDSDEARLQKGFGKMMQRFTNSVHVTLIDDEEGADDAAISVAPQPRGR